MTNEQLHMNTTPIIAVASGKGGAGKTSFTLNLANMLTKAGKRVLVFDGDVGLANIDVQLGVSPGKDLSDAIQGYATISEIITKSQQGFDLIPGRSGFEKTPFMTALERKEILSQVRDAAVGYDVVLLDVAAGIDDEVMGLAKFADRTLLVVTPDPSSITDAYALIKLLKIRHDRENCEIVINQAGTEKEGLFTFSKLKTAAEKFLHVNVPLVGTVLYDREYSRAVKMQKLVTEQSPASPASIGISTIANRLLPAGGMHPTVEISRSQSARPTTV